MSAALFLLLMFESLVFAEKWKVPPQRERERERALVELRFKVAAQQ